MIHPTHADSVKTDQSDELGFAIAETNWTGWTKPWKMPVAHPTAAASKIVSRQSLLKIG
jgi:hypothetical protein